MKKNRKSQRRSTPKFLLVILPFLAICISFYVIYKGIQNYVTTSDYFKIKEFKVEGIQESKYLNILREENLGENIFLVDTKRLSKRIERRFPCFYNVTVRRVLPSQLLIICEERTAVAAVKRDCYYLFDADGVVLAGLDSSRDVGVPLIIGLENTLKRVEVGLTYHSGILHKSLLLAKALKDNHSSIEASMSEREKFRATRIDATSANNLSFYLGQAIEIKVGDKAFKSRIRLLPAILRSLEAELPDVSYIDLRPKEPVVAYKKK